MNAGGLGELIKAARLRRGWTQQDLADRLDVDRAYVSAMESGRRWPQQYVRGLSHELGLSQVDMAVAAGLIDPTGDVAPVWMPPPDSPWARMRAMGDRIDWRGRPDVAALMERSFRDLLDEDRERSRAANQPSPADSALPRGT